VSQRGNELVNAIWSSRFNHQRTGRFYAPVFSFYVTFRSTDRDGNARRPHLRRVPASRSSSALGFANRRESLSRTLFSLPLSLSLLLFFSFFLGKLSERSRERRATALCDSKTYRDLAFTYGLHRRQLHSVPLDSRAFPSFADLPGARSPPGEAEEDRIDRSRENRVKSWRIARTRAVSRPFAANCSARIAAPAAVLQRAR